MSKIFRELIDANYPIISHKCFNSKDCCEHLISERNIIGYVLKGEKRIDNKIVVSAGDLFCMSIGNYTVVYEADENEGVYEEVAVCFTVEHLRTLLTGILSYEEIKNSILSRKNSYTEAVLKEPITINTKRVFDGLLYCCNNSADKAMQEMLDKIKITELLFTILTDETLEVGAAVIKMVRCNHDKLRSTISECVGRRFTIEQIAAKCSMSTSQFKKIFGQIYGTTPHKWFAKEQLEKAAFLLRTSDHQISAIAEECEFSNPSHLIKRFKEAYQQTPSEYRKNTLGNK